VALAFFHNPSWGRALGILRSECEKSGEKEHHVHPREKRFNRDGEFALIWLTEEEFCGKVCDLPGAGPNASNACQEYLEFLDEDFPPEWFRLEAYEDPNVGFQPMEQEEDDEEELDEQLEAKELREPMRPSSPPPSYVSPYSERGGTQGLLDVGSHLGGTSFSARGLPSGLSSYYLEIAHGFGGLDFGGEGNGQLDLLNETWTWQW